MQDHAHYEDKLRAWLHERAIEAELLVFPGSCHSVAEAAASAGVAEQDVVKNICLVDHLGRLLVAIARGDDRVSTRRVGKALESPPPRIAAPGEIERLTGYPVGGTPSFGYPATTLIDPRVMERALVYSGGGSTRSLLRIAPAELLRASAGRVLRVRR